ncbi:hypothetical protein ACPW7J_07385 [Ihubacter sp. rT4E-8]|uniref:hypothetical protein n=1 Tax=Ihubacter sp. rT4E-8 TaxID=3242369 RepID=UPI003CF24344
MRKSKITGDDVWHIMVALLLVAILFMQFKIASQRQRTEIAISNFEAKAVHQLEDLNYIVSDLLEEKDE